MTAIDELSELRQQVESLLAANAELLGDFLVATAEVERLTECLKAANTQAEHFEREWYLVGNERDDLRARVVELESERLPDEQGKNRYGVDVAYFRKTINRELNRPLVDYRPDELARVLARLSVTADSAVVMEPEFRRPEALAKIKAEAVWEACEHISKDPPEQNWDSDYPEGYIDAIDSFRQYANQIEGGDNG